MKRAIKEILKGYFGFVKRLATILLYLGASLVVSIILVLPLWALATHKPGIFSIIAAVLFAALIATLITVRVRSVERKTKALSGEKRGVVRALVLTGLFLFLAAGLYVLTLLVLRGLYGIAVPGVLIYLFVLGYGFFASKFSKKSA